MTTTAERDEKQEAKDALKARAEAMEAKEKELNKGKTGKGTRTFLGLTRGRNPQEIKYEAFDESQPATLPTSIAEFVELTKTADEKKVVEYLISGYNDANYSAASDPVAEFLNPEWDDDRKAQFRIVVRNYAANAGVSIEDAVNLIKPGIEAAFQKAKEKS